MRDYRTGVKPASSRFGDGACDSRRALEEKKRCTRGLEGPRQRSPIKTKNECDLVNWSTRRPDRLHYCRSSSFPPAMVKRLLVQDLRSAIPTQETTCTLYGPQSGTLATNCCKIVQDRELIRLERSTSWKQENRSPVLRCRKRLLLLYQERTAVYTTARYHHAACEASLLIKPITQFERTYLCQINTPGTILQGFFHINN